VILRASGPEPAFWTETGVDGGKRPAIRLSRARPVLTVRNEPGGHPASRDAVDSASCVAFGVASSEKLRNLAISPIETSPNESSDRISNKHVKNSCFDGGGTEHLTCPPSAPDGVGGAADDHRGVSHWDCEPTRGSLGSNTIPPLSSGAAGPGDATFGMPGVSRFAIAYDPGNS